MKKWIIGFIFFGVSVAGFSQSNVSAIVSECTRVLGQNVPSDYSRSTRTRFVKHTDEATFVVHVENGKVFLSAAGVVTYTTNAAQQWSSRFYNFFEENNWQFVMEGRDGDIYRRNSVYAHIVRPSRRDDGFITSLVEFSNSLEVLF